MNHLYVYHVQILCTDFGKDYSVQRGVFGQGFPQCKGELSKMMSERLDSEVE